MNLKVACPARRRPEARYKYKAVTPERAGSDGAVNLAYMILRKPDRLTTLLATNVSWTTKTIGALKIGSPLLKTAGIIGAPQPQPRAFFGRRDLVRSVRRDVRNAKVTVLYGDPGAGKTRAAAEAVHNLGIKGWWTQAGDTATDTLYALAPLLGVSEGSGTESDVKKAGREVARLLSGMKTARLWVIDNMPDEAQITDLVARSAEVKLLITVRGRLDSPSHGWRQHDVARLDAASAVALLRSRAGQKVSAADKALPKIAEAVGGLPLALEALALRLGSQTTPAEVLKRVESPPEPTQYDVFKERLGDSVPKSKGAFHAISGALESLPQGARAFLSGFGYVADAPVPWALATALGSQDEASTAQVLEACARQSVLKFRAGKSVSVHPLVAAAIAATVRPGSFKKALGGVTKRAFDTSQKDSRPFRAELPHLMAFLAHAHSELGEDDPLRLSFGNMLAAGCSATGRNREAVGIWEHALQIKEKTLGPEHPETLAVRCELAGGYCAIGRSAEAVALDEETLRATEKTLGPDHPDTLAVRNNLAAGYRAMGRTVDALKLWQQTLAIRERVLGPEHKDTLASRDNLAVGYKSLGRNGLAAKLDEETLQVRLKTLGEEHPDTLASRSNLADCYRALGRHKEAVKLDEVTLRLREAVLGPEHLDTIASRNSLMIGYAMTGRAATALPSFEKNLEIAIHVLGPDHPATIEYRRNLAKAYRDSGRSADAKALERG